MKHKIILECTSDRGFPKEFLNLYQVSDHIGDSINKQKTSLRLEITFESNCRSIGNML